MLNGSGGGVNVALRFTALLISDVNRLLICGHRGRELIGLLRCLLDEVRGRENCLGLYLCCTTDILVCNTHR